MTYIFLIILIYLAFRFITGFLIPVFRTTSRMRSQFNQMKQQMDEQQQGQHATPPQKPRFDVEGEYIPFEEVNEKSK